MRIITTLPPPQHEAQMSIAARHSLVSGARFNIGARTPYSPLKTLELILAVMGNKEFWLDLKGRQLRITKWAMPTYGDIELNHEFEVEYPAQIIFRDGQMSSIQKVIGKRIYVDPDPPTAVGAGQAVNIHSANLKIKGYFTDEDLLYIEAAKSLGIHNYMLSFVEEESDIIEMIKLDPQCKIVAKIESPKGLQFVRDIYPQFKDRVNLLAARDDLFINIGDDKLAILKALEDLLLADPETILASRLLTSLQTSPSVSLADLSDLQLMFNFGYRNFMLSDSLCFKREPLLKALGVLEQFITNYAHAD
jgi:pyruvate kinase